MWPERDADHPSVPSAGVQNPYMLASSCTKSKNPYHLFDVSLSFITWFLCNLHSAASRYELEGSNSGRGKFLFFSTVIMCLRISKPPLQWVTAFCRGGKVAGRKVYHSLKLVPTLRTSGAVPPLLL